MRRHLAVVACCLAVAMACSTASDDPAVVIGDDPPATNSAPGAVPPTQADGSPAPTDAQAPPPSSGDAPAPPPTDSGSPAPPATDPPVESAAPPSPGGVGFYAPFYLQADESASIAVEVRSQAGAAPSPSTLDHVRSTLASVSGKPVDIVQGSVPGDGQDWTADELRALGDTGAAQSRDRSVLRLYFLNGSFEGDSGVLGIAVRSDMTAVFAEQVTSASGLVGDRNRVERAVALHEVGHVLGLVDLHLDTGREDPEHPGHSPNRGSVMYWAVESSLVGQVLQGGPPTEFDDADLADLARIRNG